MLKEMMCFVGLSEADKLAEDKKLEKMKKKLADLEVERCHKKLAKENLVTIDEKIAKQKQRCAKHCQEVN